MGIPVQTRLFWPFVLATALVAAVGSILYWNALKLDDGTRWVAHTHDVIGQLERTLSTVKDAETGQRGYLLTGEDAYLAPYNAAIAQVGRDVDRLRTLTADNAEQQRRIAPIEVQISARLEGLAKNIELRRKQGLDAARQSVLNGQGKALMDELRRMVREMADEEERLLDRRELDSRAALGAISIAYLASILGSLGVLGALYWALARYFRARDRAEAAIRDQREWLEVTLTSIGDAVIATDAEGRVSFINPVARALCGWSAEAVFGRPLPEVFRIVNETTRAVVENPVEKVLECGHIVGLANHTVLIASDGSECPIEDSAAPIRGVDGRIAGVILVFHDVREKRAAELAAGEAQQQTTDLLESITDGFFAVDREWDITYVNPQFENILGLKPGDVLGKSLWDVYPGLDDNEFGRLYRRVAETRSSESATAYYEHFRRWYEFQAYPAKDGITVFFRDVTERKRDEVVLDDQKHILELMAGDSSLGEVLDALCRMVERHSGSTLLASVLVLDGDRLRHGGAPNLPEAYNRAIDGIPVGSGVGSCGTAVHRREPVFVADIAADPLWADFAELALSHNLRACWSMPILSAAGEVLGTFAMYHPNPRHPTPDDLHLVDVVTRTAAIAIERERAAGERRRAAEAAARRSEQLQRLAEISARINAARDVQSVVRVVTEEARQLVGARQAATTLLANPTSQPVPLSIISTESSPSYILAEPRDLGIDFFRTLGDEFRPIRLAQADIERDPRWKEMEKDLLVRPTEGGLLAAPLVARGGQAMGLLQLADKAEGEFTEDDEAILMQLSRLAAIAIENARLYEELRANDQRKDEFLAMLAHELRNPLSAIGNAVNLSARGGLQEHIDWSMDVITRQMKHLTRLIDDLLDVSRINRGKIELRRAVLDLTPILASAAATVRPLIEERKHRLEVAVDRGNLWVDADATRLEQVVVNLLNNAAKYSDNEGHIRLSARAVGEEVVLTVSDQGLGIPPERLPQMFELFAQGDRTLARSEGGLGIGLTVVKKLVELHGGSIEARSEGLGKGSEFMIRLPASKGPTVAGPKATRPIAEMGKKARILVVDDNEDTAKGMARLLKLIGHEIAVAHNGFEALDVARGFEPEFVLLDIGLPGMDGYEVASRLRRDDRCKQAVIVAVSGYGQDEDRRRSKEAGFDHHLIKPLDHDALLMILSTGSNRRT